LLGPAEPPVSRIRNQYLFQTLIKLERSGKLIQQIKDRIREEVQKLDESSAYRSVSVVLDVDPY
jgi:primosomal protein N' (replication factor Y)